MPRPRHINNAETEQTVFKRSDETLIDKAIHGDERAWQQLVGRYQSALYYYSLRLMGNPDDARDLLQDVLLVLCRNLAQFRGDSSFKTWLFGIANYRAMDMLRKRKPTQDLDDLPELEHEDQLSHEQQLSEQQTQILVQQKLKTLPPEQKLVVELRFYQHFTFDEIADQLAISSNTVKSRFYSALDKLRVQLEDHDVEQSASF